MMPTSESTNTLNEKYCEILEPIMRRAVLLRPAQRTAIGDIRPGKRPRGLYGSFTKSWSIPKFQSNKYSVSVIRLRVRTTTARVFPIHFPARLAPSLCRSQTDALIRSKHKAVLNRIAGRPGKMLFRVGRFKIHP